MSRRIRILHPVVPSCCSSTPYIHTRNRSCSHTTTVGFRIPSIHARSTPSTPFASSCSSTAITSIGGARPNLCARSHRFFRVMPTQGCLLAVSDAPARIKNKIKMHGQTHPKLRADVKVPQHLLAQVQVLLVHPWGRLLRLNASPESPDLHIADSLCLALGPRLGLRFGSRCRDHRLRVRHVAFRRCCPSCRLLLGLGLLCLLCLLRRRQHRLLGQLLRHRGLGHPVVEAQRRLAAARRRPLARGFSCQGRHRSRGIGGMGKRQIRRSEWFKYIEAASLDYEDGGDDDRPSK